MQTKLDMWSSRDLTIFGRARLIKTLGISQLIYSASNLDVPQGIADIVKTKSFKFLWKNQNWCIIPKHYFRRKGGGGGLNFLLRCHYDKNYLNDLPIFYKKIRDFFNELKILHTYDQKQELILYWWTGNPFFSLHGLKKVSSLSTTY